jgi:peptidyl-prolyl cis-trans isomerase SurA
MIPRIAIIVGTVVWLATSVLPARAGDLLDRIVAAVNGHVILQSDWEDAVRYEAFVAARPADQSSPEERKAALDRLIDQELLREQIRSADFPAATDEEVAARVREIRERYMVAPDNPVAWQAVLTRYHLTENELNQRVALELNLMRLVDARLRPTVSIDAPSIESYYNQELLPQLRQAGAKEVSLADVTPKIRELLTQQKVNELLVSWLQNLRAGSEIRTTFALPGSGGEAR